MNQKGISSIVIILLIVGVLAAAGGIYYLAVQKPSQPEQPQPVLPEQPDDETTGSGLKDGNKINSQEISGEEYLYALALEERGTYPNALPYYKILKIDPKALKIVKETQAFRGKGIKIRYNSDENGYVENIYVLAFPYSKEMRIENVLQIFNKDLEEKAIHSIAEFNPLSPKEEKEIITDFEVNKDFLYFLKGKVDLKNVYRKEGKILEIAKLENYYKEIKKISSLNFDKTVHDIIFKNNKIYLLDNRMMPLYIHIVDVKNPEELGLFTYEFSGINAHLDTHDIEKIWFIVENYGHRGGSGQNLAIFSAESPIEKIGFINLYSFFLRTNESKGILKLEKDERVGVIKAAENYLYVLAGTREYMRGTNKLDKLKFYTLDIQDLENIKLVSSLILTENSAWTTFDSPSLIKKDNFLYWGDKEGIFVIDITNPASPFIKNVIKTNYPIISLVLGKSKEEKEEKDFEPSFPLQDQIDSCRNKPEFSSYNYPLETCILEVAFETGKEEVCGEDFIESSEITTIPNPEGFYEFCHILAAFPRQDFNICKNFNFKFFNKKMCEDLFNYIFAETGKNINYCQKIEDKKLKKECNDVFKDITETPNLYEKCVKFSFIKHNYGRNQCFLDNAKTVEECKRIDHKTSMNNCIKRLAQEKNDIVICDEIEDDFDFIKKQCKEIF